MDEFETMDFGCQIHFTTGIPFKYLDLMVLINNPTSNKHLQIFFACKALLNQSNLLMPQQPQILGRDKLSNESKWNLDLCKKLNHMNLWIFCLMLLITNARTKKRENHYNGRLYREKFTNTSLRQSDGQLNV